MRLHAARIPDSTLRRLALEAQRDKRENLEGAAAFAAFTPRPRRASAARLLVRLQGIYDYADVLAEQPGDDPSANALALHSAMLAALQPGRPHARYYAHHPSGDDGGYLTDLVNRCRLAVVQLPAYPVVAEAARRNTQRIIDYQIHINDKASYGHPSLVSWANRETPPESGLRWWETAAACGSSLAVFALLAAATNQTLSREHASAIEDLYWPWAGALHTLLDNLIDRSEDRRDGQHNLTGHYTSPQEMAARLGLLAGETAKRTDRMSSHHRLILAGMVALYLADEHAWTPFARPASERILAATGPLAKPALLLLRLRRRAAGA